MKANMCRKVSVAVILFGSAAAASMAQAQLLNGAIGFSASSADTYKINCGAGTVGARARITDTDILSDQVKLSVQVVKLTNAITLEAASATTPVDILSFNIADLAEGVANYHAIVSKTGGGLAEPYTIDLYCYNAAGARIGPNAVLHQNQ